MNACLSVDNPFIESVNMEILLWNVPERIRGKVETVEQMAKKILAHSKYSRSNIEFYLRQHRQRRTVIAPLLIRCLGKEGVEIEPTEDGFTKGYDIYSLRRKGSNDLIFNVGYKCGECESLFIGPPLFEGNHFSTDAEKAYFCGECGIEMDRFPNLSIHSDISYLNLFREGLALGSNQSVLTRR